MPRVQPPLQSFNAGEIAPRLASRTDFSKYRASMEVGENLIPLSEGPLMRRSGSRYAWALKDSTVKGRLLPFQFSTTQAYMLEFGAAILRFGRNQGQITVPNTDAAVTNGGFDSDTSDWDDRSTGAAAISHDIVGATDEGTFDQPNAATFQFGDSIANGLNIGFMFTNTTAGDVASVTVSVNAVGAAFNAVAKIYTNSSGSPGTQVGGNSATVNLNGTGNKQFTWSTKPSISAATAYWVVITDTTADTTGDVTLNACADQGSTFASGRHDTITSIADGSGSMSTSYDWRMEISVETGTANGVLSLDGNGSDIAWAEQDITTTATATEHVLRFRVLGAPGDTVQLRIGEETLGAGLVNDKVYAVGYHCVSFTPAVSPFYVQFRNLANKSILIDDVALLDNEPVELVTPYAEADLYQISGPQSADVLYLFHTSYPTYKLERYGHTSWSLVEVAWQDGPWLDQNPTYSDATPTTLTFSAATGNGVTVTASALAGINGGLGFQSTDVGRLIRLSEDSTINWGWAVITAVTSSLLVTVDVKRTVTVATAEKTWRLGAWSATTGYPSTGAFFEQRLFGAGTTDQPQTFWAGQTADFENMSPDSDPTSGTWDGTVQDDDAFDYTISSENVDAIRWLSAGEDVLAIGTTGGEWIPSSTGAVLTPSDITVRRQTTHGSAQVQPVRIDNTVLHLQRGKRKVREFAFNWESDGYKGFDMTRLARHVTYGGVVEMAYAEEPNSIIWAVRNDGQLLSMTYRREEDVVGWTRHLLGGTFYQSISQVWQVAVGTGGGGYPQTAAPTETQFGSESVNHAVTMPPTVNSGDLLMVTIGVTDNGGSADPGLNTPSGWTQLWNSAYSNTSSRAEGGTYIKVAAGTEGGGTVDFVTDNAAAGAAQCYRVTNWHGAIADVEVSTTAAGASTTPDAPSLTPSWGGENTLWFVTGFCSDDDETVSAYPTSYSGGADTISGAGTDSGSTVFSARRELSAMSEDPDTLTLTGSEAWRAVTVAVRPSFTFVDETTDANDTDNADWTVFPASEAVGDYMAVGYTEAFTKLVFDYANGTAGVGGVVTWEYWNGSVWTALSNVTDNTAGFTTAVADNLTVIWTMPADWAPRQLNTGRKLYYVRARITTVYTTNPVLDQGYIGDHAVAESVAVIPGTNGAGQTQDSTDRDEAWLIVKRTINGATKRYAEFLERDYEIGQTQEDAYYLDSLITYDSSATTSITGLDHLEGEVVGVLGDGLIQADKTVSGGAITIATEAKIVQVGLRYKHRYKTWRFEGGNPQGTAQGRTSQVTHLTFDVQHSMTLDHGPDVATLTSETLGDGTNYYSGLSDRFGFSQDWGPDSRVYVENDDPVPFMMRGIYPEWTMQTPP